MKIKLYRLRIADRYCTINRNFHADGVAIPDATLQTATVLNHWATADDCIERTHKLRDETERSMLRDWPPLQPLLFKGDVTREEFEVEE